ncbi:MAG: alpha/beta fold hydrolase [Pseudomonadota bacterium]
MNGPADDFGARPRGQGPVSVDPSFGLIDAARRMIRLGGNLADRRRRAVTIADTPKDEIWRDGKISLARYRPLVEPELGPLVIVHGMVGRQSMTDLEPKRSLVRRLLERAVDVYVLDWGNPTRADRYRNLADYADLSLGDALDAVEAHSGEPRAVLFGLCQGGVFAACHAALYPARLKGLALAVTPIDFHADRTAPALGRGQLNVWLRALPAELIEALIADGGNVPGHLSGQVFNGLQPGKWVAKYTADLAEIGDDPDALDTFLRMEKWLADRPDQPGALARDWLIGLYRENRLVEGRLTLDGVRVDLGCITCPVLNVYAEHDHIIPPPCSRALKQHLRNAAYREIAVPTGHIGVFVSQKAQGIVAPGMVEWMRQAA